MIVFWNDMEEDLPEEEDGYITAIQFILLCINSLFYILTIYILYIILSIFEPYSLGLYIIFRLLNII